MKKKTQKMVAVQFTYVFQSNQCDVKCNAITYYENGELSLIFFSQLTGMSRVFISLKPTGDEFICVISPFAPIRKYNDSRQVDKRSLIMLNLQPRHTHIHTLLHLYNIRFKFPSYVRVLYAYYFCVGLIFM